MQSFDDISHKIRSLLLFIQCDMEIRLIRIEKSYPASVFSEKSLYLLRRYISDKEQHLVACLLYFLYAHCGR